jgi:hypothetical protein
VNIIAINLVKRYGEYATGSKGRVEGNLVRDESVFGRLTTITGNIGKA